ncbi:MULTISPECIES: hypothetical protein [Micrococcaceae]|uniref:hypothetical protein n=1 Tax=unclassified Kocuria TaxID=2649579 RepID=UPI001013B750|nr:MULTISPECIES: hypothetical protein [unclassified Kocuria]
MKKITFFSVLVFFLVGCGAAEGGAKSEPNASESSESLAIESLAAATSPDPQAIEKVDELFRQTPAMHDAVEKEIGQCVSNHGARWVARSHKTPSVRSLASPSELNVEDARVQGYVTDAGLEDPESLPSDMEKKAISVFIGDPENGSVSVEGVPGGISKDGCLAFAYEKVFGSAESGVVFEGAAGNLPLPYVNAAMDSEETRGLEKKWSECMKNDENLEFETPDIIHAKIKNPGIDIAVADAKCREKVDFENQLRKQLNAYLTTFLKEKQGLITKVSDAKRAAESNVLAILGQ